MNDLFKQFLKEEDGLGTVEIVIIIAVLVGLALIFRKQLYSLVDQIFSKIFSSADDPISAPETQYTGTKKLGG